MQHSEEIAESFCCLKKTPCLARMAMFLSAQARRKRRVGLDERECQCAAGRAELTVSQPRQACRPHHPSCERSRPNPSQLPADRHVRDYPTVPEKSRNIHEHCAGFIDYSFVEWHGLAELCDGFYFLLGMIELLPDTMKFMRW